MTEPGEALCRVSKHEPFAKGASSAHYCPTIGLDGMVTRSVSDENVAAPASGESPHVAIVDSHSLTRECIAKSLSGLFKTMKIWSFISVTDCNSRRGCQFSLILLYLHPSDCQPLDLIRNLRTVHDQSIVFLISDLDYQANPDFIRAAWRLGTRGFVSTKATSLTLALSAISFVQAGGFFFAPVEDRLSRSSPPRDALPAPASLPQLTTRETVVLGLLKQGKTNKVIARELRLSSNTVKVHVHNILRKMQARNRTEAASLFSPTIASTDGTVMILS